MSNAAKERRSNSTTPEADPAIQEAGKIPTIILGRRIVSDVKLVNSRNSDNAIENNDVEKRIAIANAFASRIVFETKTDVVNKIAFEKKTVDVSKTVNVRISNVAVSNFNLETSEINSEVKPEALLRSDPELHPDWEPRQRQQSARRFLFIEPKRVLL
jgi:hypothetical protein